ncbi:MAG: TIM barrel protein [Solirubrobacterales bacterium]
MKHSVSIRFMWPEVPFAERGRRAAEAGFDCVEMWDWRGEDIDGLHEVCEQAGTAIAGFFGHSRGGLADPSQHEEVLECLAESIEVAEGVGAWQLHMFSDDIGPDSTIRKPPPLTDAKRREATAEGLRRCLELVEGRRMELVVESINTVFVPGYFLDGTGASIDVCRELAHPQVRMFFDCFHQQLVGGRLIENLIGALPWVAAVHVADVPGRHQPGTGEINFHSIRRVLEEHGYDGQLTFEVDPKDGDSDAAVAAIKEVFPF